MAFVSDPGYHKSFPAWAIALTVIGVLVFLALVIGIPVAVCCCYSRRNKPPTLAPVANVQPAGQHMAVSMQVIVRY